MDIGWLRDKFKPFIQSLYAFTADLIEISTKQRERNQEAFQMDWNLNADLTASVALRQPQLICFLKAQGLVPFTHIHCSPYLFSASSN